MFGYVVINKSELKFREFDEYHTYYCGLCHCLKKRYGVFGQMSLSYDMTFTALLLSNLYEQKEEKAYCHCIAHPFEKHPYYHNEILDYCADMNVLLTIYKCEDDWVDEKKLLKNAYGNYLRNRSKAKRKQYKAKEDFIRDRLFEISKLEKQGCEDIDKISAVFGEIMGEILVYSDDEWADTLRRIGYYLGKFIYILDAYDDIEKDIKKGNYNPLKKQFENPDFDDNIHTVLTMMISECCKEFEVLPIIENIDILRNILYSGVWSRYELVRDKRNAKEQKEAHEQQ